MSDPKRYKLSELSSLIKERSKTQPTTSKERKGKFKFRMPNAEEEKNLRAMVNVACMEKDFEKTWRRQRDFASASEYQFSIAIQLLQANWAKDTVAGILYIWRKDYASDEKPGKEDRIDYIETTIANAIKKIGAHKAFKEIEAITKEVKEHKKEGKKEGKTEDQIEEEIKDRQHTIISGISERLGIPIIGVIKEGEDNCLYTLVLQKDKPIFIGQGSEFLDLNHIRHKVMDATDEVVPRLKREDWDKCAKALLNFAQKKDNPDITRRGMITAWLSEYLENAPEVKEHNEDHKNAVLSCEPYLQNGNAFVNMGNLKSHLFKYKGERITKNTLVDMLRILGGKPTSFASRVEGKVIHRRYWCVSTDEMSTFEG